MNIFNDLNASEKQNDATCTGSRFAAANYPFDFDKGFQDLRVQEVVRRLENGGLQDSLITREYGRQRAVDPRPRFQAKRCGAERLHSPMLRTSALHELLCRIIEQSLW
jgi:hypothetical protein